MIGHSIGIALRWLHPRVTLMDGFPALDSVETAAPFIVIIPRPREVEDNTAIDNIGCTFFGPQRVFHRLT